RGILVRRGGRSVRVIRGLLLLDSFPQARRRGPVVIAPVIPFAITPIAAIGIVRLLLLAPASPSPRISPVLRIGRKHESANDESRRGRSGERQNAGGGPPATSQHYPSSATHGLFRGFRVQHFTMHKGPLVSP